MSRPNNAISKEIVIVNETGLHARSAAKIVGIAQKAKSNIWLSKGEDQVDATGLIDLLTLECTKGTRIRISVEDHDDIVVLDEIVKLVESGFGE